MTSRFFTLKLVALVAIMGFFTAETVMAQSAKATARVGNVNILKASSLDWTTIMRSDIKTASYKELLIDVSMECALMTRTKVRSKRGEEDTSSANAAVKVRVLVDGKVAAPGEITFCRRNQELTATFGGILEECTDANGDGTIVQDECIFSDEELELLLETMNANAFNFVAMNLNSGDHRVEVQARIDSGSSAQLGEAEANASIGHGAVTIEEVRMIKNDVVDF